MNKLLLIPIILGGGLLVVGGVIVGITASNIAKTSATYAESVHEISEEIKSFDIDLSTEAFKIVASQDGKSVVTCDDSEKVHHTVKVEDGVLRIRRTDEREWFEKIFNWNFNEMKVTVTIPEGAYSNLRIEASTGAVTVPSGFSFQKADIKLSTGALDFAADVEEDLHAEASTGAVQLKDVEAKSIYAKVSTGALRIQNVEVHGDLTASASTGATLLENVRATNLVASASTGVVTLKNTIIEERMEIKTSNGDVKIEDSDAASVYIECSTGDVNATFLTSKIVYASSDTGRVDVPHSTEGGKCEIETSTGSIIVRFKA